MVKPQIQEEEEEDDKELELSETAHLRRKYVPTLTQPVYECVRQEKKMTKQEEPRPPQQRRSLRRQISLSLDNVMKNGLFKKRDSVEAKQENGRTRKSFRNNERPVFEVQHNNASRLRMLNQARKQTKS